MQYELKQLIHERKDIFPDVPSRTNAVYHDADVSNDEAIKQHPYRVNPLKKEHLKEIEYMLENNIIEANKSEWSSPCILVPKPDGSYRFVTDFRKVNQCSKICIRFRVLTIELIKLVVQNLLANLTF